MNRVVLIVSLFAALTISIMASLGLVVASASTPEERVGGHYPARPGSLQPVLVYLEGEDLGDVYLDSTIRVIVDAGIVPIDAPPCSGNRIVRIYATLTDMSPASSILIVAKNIDAGVVCSTTVNAGSSLTLDTGRYTIIAFYDEDGDTVYEYAGTASIEILPVLPGPYELHVTLEHVSKLLDTRLSMLAEGVFEIKQPMIQVPGFYVAFIPGLPSLRLIAATSDVSVGDIPPDVVKAIHFAVNSIVHYKIYVNEETVIEDTYSVEPATETNIPPTVVVFVSELLENLDIVDETFGLAPSGWSHPAGKELNITVIAFDDKSIEYLGFYVSVNGGQWVEIPLRDMPIAVLMKKVMQDYFAPVASYLSDLLEVLGEIGVINATGYELDPPPLLLKYALIPAQQPGSYVLFRANVSDGTYNSVSFTSLYYVYNTSATKRILIVDPNVLLWLLKYNVEVYEHLFRGEYLSQVPIVSTYAEKIYGNNAFKALRQFVGLLQPFHHWEHLAHYYQVRILTNLSLLVKELEEYRPHVIVLSNIWLGYNSTKDPRINWDLRDLGLADDLIQYVRENHAGLIVTHATLSDLIVWVDSDGGVERVKVMPRGHVGYTLDDISLDSEKTIAGCVGLGLLPIYEYVRDKIAEYLIDLASKTGAYPLKLLGMAIGSTPILVPWVPWNGSLTETNATHLLGWNIPTDPVVIPNPYSIMDPEWRAYTLVGWQLGSPIAGVEAIPRTTSYAAEVARHYYGMLGSVMANITGLNVTNMLYGSLAGNMSLAYQMLANMTMQGTQGYAVLSVKGVRVPIEITLPRRLVEQLLVLAPVKLAAISPDGLAGIVTYDRYWDNDTGFRAVYFSFEVEAGVNDAAKQLLLEAVEWVLEWKPVDVLGLLENISKTVISEASRSAKIDLTGADIIAYNATFATRAGSSVSYSVEPGVYQLIIKSLDVVDINITGATVESIEQATWMLKLVKIRVDEPTRLDISLYGDVTPAILVLAKLGTLQQQAIQVFEVLYGRAAEILTQLPGAPSSSHNIILEGPHVLELAVEKGKTYIVIAYNGTLQADVKGPQAVIEHLPGVYLVAVYTREPTVVKLSLTPLDGPAYASLVLVRSTAADFDGDERVDYRDLAILARAYGAVMGSERYSLIVDVNCDGVIDYRDLAILAASYGE